MTDYLKIAREALADYRAQNQPAEEPRPFAHCPRCASYALYRKNNVGNYNCETCGLTGITEDVARRVQ